MKSLEKKYRKDELTSEELSVLRQTLNAMPDSEVEQLLYDGWMNDDIDTSGVEDERIHRMKHRVDRTIGKKRPVVSLFVQWGKVAAAILLPVFILLSVYLYRENSLIISEEMIVSTGNNERATVTLPDGTQITLNANSKLGYQPKTYNKKERKIHFDGEAYFQVYKDLGVPFGISGEGLTVHVLGTTFNLSVRKKNQTAELTLEEGRVRLSSTKTNEVVTLHPMQKAVLDQKTGHITVFDDEDVTYSSAWRHGDMVFRNTALSHVVRSIEENYNVSIKIDCFDCLEDTFTGTLPLTDLNEVLEVIERSYHLKASIVGREILLGTK